MVMAVKRDSEESQFSVEINEVQLANIFRTLGYQHQGSFKRDMRFLQGRVADGSESEQRRLYEQIDEAIDES